MKIAPENTLTHTLQPRIAQRVFFSDNTMRDGEQAPHVAFTRDEKRELARLLDALGLDMISAGFPAVSPEELRTAQEITALGLRCRVRVLARLHPGDFEVAVESGAKVISTWIPLSDLHIRQKLRTTEDELAARLQRLLPQLARDGHEIRIGFEDATRAPLERILRFCQLVQELGVAALSLSDTCGVLTPSTAYRLVELVKPTVERCQLMVHFHNDLGLATANSLAALEAGADGVDGTITGLGERAGNTRIEELAVILKVKYGLDVPIRLQLLPEVAAFVARIAGRPIAADKPIVGGDVYTHESGIHVAGILGDPAMYQPFDPALVGREHGIAWGKHSGLKGLLHLLESNGLSLSRRDAEALLLRIKHQGERKEHVHAHDIVTWARALEHEA